jgi:hypothetical protein
MNTNRITLWACAAISALAFACGGDQQEQVVDDQATDDGVTDQDMGTVEQAYSIEVASGSQSRIFGIPRTFQEYFRSCDSSTTGAASCSQGTSGNTLTGPAHTTFTVASADSFLRARLTESCGSLHASAPGWSCSVGSTCSSATSLCLTRASVADIHGVGSGDLRRFHTIGCQASSSSGPASFNGISYTLKRCDNFAGFVDVSAIGATGADSAQNLTLGRMVVNNVFLQSVGVGGTISGSTTANRWNYGAIPGTPPALLTTGQLCRLVHNNVSQIGSFSFTTTSNCPNN